MNWKGAVQTPINQEPEQRSVGKSEPVPVDVLTRARAYIAEMPEAIEGDNGSRACFNVARKLADYGLTEGQIVQVLRDDYNPRCEPAWSTKELKHKANAAVNKRRTKNPISDRPKKKSNGKTNGHVSSNANGADATKSTSTAPGYALLDASAIWAPLQEPDYLIDGLIRRGSLTEIVAYGSSGKSWLAVDMVISVGSGLPWLDFFPCKKGRGVYLDYENGNYEMRRRMHAITAARGIATPVEGVWLCCVPDIYMSDPKFGVQVRTLAGASDLIIVDTLKAANPGVDENDSNMRVGLDGMRRAAELTGCAFVVLVHAKKTSGALTAIDAREAGRGSSAIFDAADTVLHVKYEEKKPLRVLQTKSRLGRVADPFLVRIEDTAAGVIVRAESDSSANHEEASIRFNKHCDEVLDCLKTFPGASKRLLSNKLEKHFNTVTAALEMLERHGAVTATGAGQAQRWHAVQRETQDHD